MANYIKITCPSCGHEWHEDLDQHQAQQIIYKGRQQKTKVETYRFKCSQDGTYVVVEVEIEE